MPSPADDEIISRRELVETVVLLRDIPQQLKDLNLRLDNLREQFATRGELLKVERHIERLYSQGRELGDKIQTSRDEHTEDLDNVEEALKALQISAASHNAGGAINNIWFERILNWVVPAILVLIVLVFSHHPDAIAAVQSIVP